MTDGYTVQQQVFISVAVHLIHSLIRVDLGDSVSSAQPEHNNWMRCAGVRKYTTDCNERDLQTSQLKAEPAKLLLGSAACCTIPDISHFDQSVEGNALHLLVYNMHSVTTVYPLGRSGGASNGRKIYRIHPPRLASSN